MTDEIKKILYKWFDIKYRTYDKLEHDGSIYWYYMGNKYADIVIDKKHQEIHYNWDFYEEFCEIIFIKIVEFKQVMTNWVEDTFNLKRFMLIAVFGRIDFRLEIPK